MGTRRLENPTIPRIAKTDKVAPLPKSAKGRLSARIGPQGARLGAEEPARRAESENDGPEAQFQEEKKSALPQATHGRALPQGNSLSFAARCYRAGPCRKGIPYRDLAAR